MLFLGREMTRAVLLLAWLGACGRGAAAPAETDQLTLIGDDPMIDVPSLRRVISFEPRRQELGWGSFDFAANPEEHEFRVSLIVGEQAAERRWSRCDHVDVHIDGQSRRFPARYAGVGMGETLFDAVSVELSIEDVEQIARARRVSVAPCGDAIALPSHELEGLNDFVREFVEMATYDGPAPPRPPPELRPDHRLPNPRPRYLPVPS
jgi:hypothetical protein